LSTEQGQGQTYISAPVAETA